MVDELNKSIDDLQKILSPLKETQFKDAISKVSTYIQSAAKNWDSLHSALQDLEKQRVKDPDEHQKMVDAKRKSFRLSLQNSIRFAHINLDLALVQALDSMVWRPKNATRADEQKKASALQKTFDRADDPAKAMLEHFRASSDPLNKYLVAGPWGHEYLRKRKIDLEKYDTSLCEMLGAKETNAGKVVLSYAKICKEIDEVEKEALKSLQNECQQNRITIQLQFRSK